MHCTIIPFKHNIIAKSNYWNRQRFMYESVKLIADYWLGGTGYQNRSQTLGQMSMKTLFKTTPMPNNKLNRSYKEN